MRRFVPVKSFNRAEDIIGQRESEIAYPVKFYVIHANNLSVALEEKQSCKRNILMPKSKWVILVL